MGKNSTSFTSETAKEALRHRKKPGRRKKIYTILRETGYSKDDMRAALQELSFYTESQLQEVVDNDRLPIITRIIAKNMLAAYEAGEFYSIQSIIEQGYGKAKQTSEVEQTTNIKGLEVVFKDVETDDNTTDI